MKGNSKYKKKLAVAYSRQWVIYQPKNYTTPLIFNVKVRHVRKCNAEP